MPPEPVRVSYISFLTRDVQALPDFYKGLFELRELESSRSDRYRELVLGGLRLGFPYIDAYQMLDMTDQADPTGVRSMVTFAVQDAATVDRLAASAFDIGARIVKSPFATGFGQYLAVLLDPEGNGFRISCET